MCSTPKSAIALKAPALLHIGLGLNSGQFHATLRQSNENVERLQQQRVHEFLSKEPEFQQQIELDTIRCPTHLIQLNSALKKLPVNQTLKISSQSKALIKDLSAASRILDLPVQTLRYRRQHFLYVTRSI